MREGGGREGGREGGKGGEVRKRGGVGKWNTNREGKADRH